MSFGRTTSGSNGLGVRRSVRWSNSHRCRQRIATVRRTNHDCRFSRDDWLPYRVHHAYGTFVAERSQGACCAVCDRQVISKHERCQSMKGVRKNCFAPWVVTRGNPAGNPGQPPVLLLLPSPVLDRASFLGSPADGNAFLCLFPAADPARRMPERMRFLSEEVSRTDSRHARERFCFIFFRHSWRAVTRGQCGRASTYRTQTASPATGRSSRQTFCAPSAIVDASGHGLIPVARVASRVPERALSDLPDRMRRIEDLAEGSPPDAGRAPAAGR